MWKLLLSILLLVTAPAFGQLESHTVSISASRSINLQPDQVLFGLSVSSSVTANLDQVVGALSGLGITSASLNNTFYPTPTTLSWNFSFTAPLSSLTTTIKSITQLEQTIAQNNVGLTLTFTVEGTQVSQQLRQAQSCSNSDLIADATSQGQKLAAAAGLTLGPIIKLTNAPTIEGAGIVPNLAVGQYVVNGAYSVGAVFSNILVVTLASPVTCSLVVEFQLLP